METGFKEGPRILVATPEATYLPYVHGQVLTVSGARAGGLSDLSACLLHSLHDRRVDVHVAIPDYRNVFRRNTLFAEGGGRQRRYERLPAANIHLAKDRCFFYQPQLSGLPVAGNIRIALAFQREIINRIIPEVQPDLIHCFDWMTGLLPAAVRDYGIPCLFTLYNLNSAKATLAAIEDRGIDAAFFWQNCYFDHMPGRYEDIRDANPVDFLTSGIFASHAVDMVSTALSRYVLSENENGLPPGLRREIRNKHTAGCLHAFDHAPGPAFNPAADRFLCQRYTPANHRLGKATNKLCIQDKLHLPLDSTVPLFFWPARLESLCSGCALIFEILPIILDRFRACNPQFIFIADGDLREDIDVWTRESNAARRVVVSEFNAGLQHLAYAAADFVLIPVGFEPSGWPCKISQRYGALPIAHGAGTIQDAVVHLDGNGDLGNGFVFRNLDATGLIWAVEEAMAFFQKPAAVKAAHLQRIMTERLTRDDKAKTLDQYIALYENLLQRPLISSGSRATRHLELVLQTAA